MLKDDLQATADLAHLDLGAEELAAALPAFEQMLGYFAAMKAADEDASVSGDSVAPRAHHQHTVEINHFRSDLNNNNPNTNPRASGPSPDELLDGAGESDGRFIVVPNVL